MVTKLRNGSKVDDYLYIIEYYEFYSDTNIRVTFTPLTPSLMY